MAAGHVSAYVLLLCVSSTIMVFYLIPEVKMSQKKKSCRVVQISQRNIRCVKCCCECYGIKQILKCFFFSVQATRYIQLG